MGRRSARGAARCCRASSTRGPVSWPSPEISSASGCVVPAADGTRVAGTIVETEAYRGPADRASHAYGGRRTRRTETMYARRRHRLRLLRLRHAPSVQRGDRRRGRPRTPSSSARSSPSRAWRSCASAVARASDGDLTSGPGKLCQALGIDRALDAADLLGPRVWIERGERPCAAARRSPAARASASTTRSDGRRCRGDSGSGAIPSSAARTAHASSRMLKKAHLLRWRPRAPPRIWSFLSTLRVFRILPGAVAGRRG